MMQLGFRYAFVPLIIYWGSQSTEKGLIRTIFPAA